MLTNIDIENCPTPAQAFDRGYDLAIAEVVALLRTSRTAGGEVITSAKHAADVISRGDAKSAAWLVELEKAEL